MLGERRKLGEKQQGETPLLPPPNREPCKQLDISSEDRSLTIHFSIFITQNRFCLYPQYVVSVCKERFLPVITIRVITICS
jgi:hypothetical protein